MNGRKTLVIGAAVAVLAIVAACTTKGSNDPEERSAPGPIPTPPVDDAFKAYWYKGLAEVNRYELKQARYGEMREGDAVLIFVTEDFLTEDQVKLESPVGDRSATSVLKMNLTKKFQTGVYPYALMTSVFTPVDLRAFPSSLKVTTSAQEWCGHTFTQINRIADAVRIRQFSYFEKEGDTDTTLEADLLEDEVWTRLRLSPESLPVGDVRLLPGTMTARLRHTPHAPLAAKATRTEAGVDSEGKRIARYTLTYAKPSPRTLTIDYRIDFPHEITGWSETYDDFGETLTTTATRTNVLLTDYWKRHAVADTALLDDLGL